MRRASKGPFARRLTSVAPKVRFVMREARPPIVSTAVEAARRRGLLSDGVSRGTPHGQDLDAYWDPEYARILDTWGEGSVWLEIPLILATFRGRVLDIACGTGKTIEVLRSLPALEVHGCDISDLLIDRAIERGIPRERVEVCDARATPYADEFFDYSYSIGSLEHFTAEGIPEVIGESRRVTRVASIHQIPVSRSGREEGWIHHARQSYHNNTSEWWLERFRQFYPTVHVLDSVWRGSVSVGKWFVCLK